MSHLRTAFAAIILFLLAGCLASSRHTRPTHPLAWLEGHWVGEGFGGQVEEVWLPERGGAMTCVFRMLADDAVTFYELVTIQRTNTDSGFEMRLKHFHPNLHGWEHRDDAKVWPLEGLRERTATFGPVTYTAIGDDQLLASVRMQEGDRTETAEIAMRRQR